MRGLFIVLLSLALCYAQPCSEGQVQCVGTEEVECIPEEFVCDVVEDCSNSWDELGCACADYEYTCANGDCIWGSLDCDGYKDCADNSDETNCETCRAFRCANGTCLNAFQICDEIEDCAGGEDEGVVCNQCHPMFEWTCDDLSCIFANYVCDGEADCPDSSDEKNCTLADAKPLASKASEQNILGSKKASRKSQSQAKHLQRKTNRHRTLGQSHAKSFSLARAIRRQTRKR